MLDFLYNYGWIIVLALAVAGYFLWYFRVHGNQKGLKKLRETAYKLMLIAEKKFGSDTGTIKFDWVADKIYGYLPGTMKVFITGRDLEEWLQATYDELQDLLDDGKLNDSNKLPG